MKFKQLIVFTYALTAAGLAIGLTSTYTKALQTEYVQARADLVARVHPEAIDKPKPKHTVVTLARDLPLGHLLAPKDLTVQHWPAGSAPEGSFRSVVKFIGAHKQPRTRMKLFKGEALLAGKVKEGTKGSALALMLDSNRRAVTIPVNEVRGVGGFVQPNDRVDIIMTEKSSTKKEKAPPPVSKVLLQNIKILAVGQNTKQEYDGPKVASSVTVAVTLAQAQKLALATTVGYLSLALRSHDEKPNSITQRVSLNDIETNKGEEEKGYIRVVIHRAAQNGIAEAPEPVVITRGRRALDRQYD